MKQTSKKIILSLLLASCFSSLLNAQVVGYWHFDEKAAGNLCDTNAGAILDASGNGHNGTASLALPYVAGSPAYGGTSALTFYTNGANDKIVVPDASAGAFNFGAGQSITIEAVIRAHSAGLNGSSAGGNIISKQGAVASAALPGEWYFRLINTAGNLRFSASDGTLRTATGTKSLTDNKWHHVAAVYDSTAHQLRVYVDYVLDGTATTTYTGTVGNTNDLCLGQQNNNGARFDGDIDFVRYSLGALSPTNFIQAGTSIANLSPTNNAGYVSSTSAASFTVGSQVGVATSNIVVMVNGVDVSSQLAFNGDNFNRTVTLPPLVANIIYNVTVSVTDASGFTASQPWTFDTFPVNTFSFEAEDYNFSGGQFIDNPVLSSADGPNNYLDQIGQEGIDFHQTNTPALTQYRIGDGAGTAFCPDVLRQAYVTAQMSDPGVVDYMLRDNADTEWLNYSRTFPAGTYHVHIRSANGGTLPVVMHLDEVTSGSTTTTQATAPIGTFSVTPTGSVSTYGYAPLTDALGHEVGLSLSGLKTLRLTFLSAGANAYLNFVNFVPVNSPQVPFLAALSPSAGAGNVVSNAPIQITVRNADTTINPGAVQLKLDTTTVTPAVTPTGSGATISYTPASNMSIGLHTVTLIFADSASTSVTNQWQFYVANQAVLGYWKFNEQTAGNFASTNAGAILDASGNARNGTVNVSGTAYVPGSFNFGATPALRFTPGPDHIVVPDPSGVFTFTNSFTMEAVIRSTNNVTTQGAIVAKNGTTDGEGEFWWRFPGAAGGHQEVGMNGTFAIGTNTLNDGNWHHVAVVYDQANGQIRLYADYILEATSPAVFGSPIGRPSDLFIGSFIGGGSELDADVDLIRISSGVLATNQFVQKTVALQPIVQSLRPANGANNVSPTALIEAVFQNRDTSVNLSSLKLFIDGNDVTADATNSSTGSTSQIDYVPATPLAGGAHTAMVTFNDTSVPANSSTNSWSFTNLTALPVLAYYQFNEKTPGNAADTAPGALIDSSGNGHNASLFLAGAGAVTPFYVQGETNYADPNALHFAYVAAATNIVTVPDPNRTFNFTANQSITMEAIIRTTNGSQSAQGCILAKQIANPGEWYWRIASTGLQRFSANNGEALKTVNSLTSLYDGQWHHIAAVYDGTTKQMRVYCDYKLDCAPVATGWTSPTALAGNTNEDLWIGAQQSGSSRYDGDIAQIRVTSAALDPSWFIQPGVSTAPPVPPQMGNVMVGAGAVSFNFMAENGHTYIVQSTDNLTGTWTNIDTVVGNGSSKLVNYPATGIRQFFRILAQ
ncbi:MAG TPA: LamG domain-containing protein [Verrucomicrobiae bacterium]|jgi:hypothetical protein